MIVPILTICDGANRSEKGALNILASFNNIYAASAPISADFHIAARILFEEFEGDGVREIAFSFQDDDHKALGTPIKGPVIVKFETNFKVFAADFVARVAVGFPRFGDYSLCLSVDGREVARVPIFVARQPV